MSLSCQLRCLAPFEDILSGILNTGLALEGGGALAVCRSILQDIFSEVEVKYEAPPEGYVPQQLRKILDIFCPVGPRVPGSDINAKRQLVLKQFVNSDLSGEIIHYCPQGCCRDKAETVQRFQRFVVWSLLPRKPGVLNRKSWNNAEIPTQWLGLLSNVWGLLPRIMTRLTQNITHLQADDPEDVDPSEPAPQAAQAAPRSAEAAAQAAAPGEGVDVENLHGLVSDLLTGLRREGQAEVEEDGDNKDAQDAPQDDQGEVDWHKLNVQRKNRAAVFCCRQDLAAELVVLLFVMQSGSRLLASYLHLSGKTWELEQRRREAETGSRTFRVVEAARGTMLKQCFDKLQQQMTSVIPGLCYQSFMRRLRALAFCGLSSMACQVHVLLQRKYAGMPYVLFQALHGDDSCLDKVLGSSLSVISAYTTWRTCAM